MFITITELKLYFNKSLIFSAVILALLSLAAGLLGEELLYKEKLFPEMTLYVVDKDKSPESTLLTGALKEYKEEILKVETGSETEAIAAAQSGEAAAAIIIPENFFADIMSGENSDAPLYLNTQNDSRAEIIKLTAFSLKEQLSAAQAGIYYVLSKAADIESFELFKNEINMSFLSVFFGREMEEETVAALGMVSNKDYYAFSFYVFMMFLISCLLIESGNVIKKGDIAALTLAKAGGAINLFAFKLLSVFVVYLALNIPIFAVMLYTGVLSGAGISGIASLFLISSVVQCSFCCLFIWGFDEIRSAGVSIFIFQLAALFFSGGLLPLVFMPEAITKLGLCYLTPNYYLTSLYISMRGGSADSNAALFAIAFSALALGASYAIAVARVKRGEVA